MLTNTEKNVVWSVIQQLTELYMHASAPKHEPNDLTPTGVTPMEWQQKYGADVRSAITVLETLTR